jgi:hypothetical protein
MSKTPNHSHNIFKSMSLTETTFSPRLCAGGVFLSVRKVRLCTWHAFKNFTQKATPNLRTPHRLLRRVNVINTVLQALIITGLKFNMDSVYAFGTSTFVGSDTGIWFLVQLSRNGRLKSVLAATWIRKPFHLIIIIKRHRTE